MLPRLDITHLSAICALYDHGATRPAAQAIGLTQPALSYRLKEAERRLGVPLFVPSGRRLTPTPAAERMVISAREILRELAGAEGAVRDRAVGVQQTLWLSVRAQTAFHWLPSFIELLSQEAPELRVGLLPDAGTAPLASLSEGRANVALVPAGAAWPQALCRLLFVDSLVAIVPADHPLALRSYLTAEELVPETFVTYGVDSEPGFEDYRVFRPAGVFPARTVLVGYASAAVQCVANGLGVTIVSRWIAAPDLSRGAVAAVPLTPEGVKLEWHVAWKGTGRHEYAASRCARALADWCASGAASNVFGVDPGSDQGVNS